MPGEGFGSQNRGFGDGLRAEPTARIGDEGLNPVTSPKTLEHTRNFNPRIFERRTSAAYCAKALIKLAETGLGCLSIPDVFHLLHDLVQGSSLSIYSRLRQARQALHQAQTQLAASQASDPQGAQARQVQLVVEATEGEVRHWEGVRRDDRQHLATLSFIVHPWRLLDATAHTSHDVEKRWQAEVTAIETLVETHGLPLKKKTLEKVRKQLVGVSALVDVWWQSVWQDVTPHVRLTPMWQQWVEELLLPLLYWQAQRSRTRCPRRQAKLLEALKALQAACEKHPLSAQLTPQVLMGWKAWATEHARTFQRASSAVEGRNGYVSQMHHNHRGLPTRRYQVWSVLHNFDCHAADGSTPASRFFRRDFPNLFETVLSHIDELPRPRRRNQAIGLSG